MRRTVKKIARVSKSRTIIWGHIQFIGGIATTALPFVTRDNFPDLPPSVYGGALLLCAVITYVLRSVTRNPLDELGDSNASPENAQ